MTANTAESGRKVYPLHAGQKKALSSTRRFVLISAGKQSGKTFAGPHWLLKEIVDRGPGDYLVASPSWPLMRKKCLPEFIRIFQRDLRIGRYIGGDKKMFVFSDEGAKRLFGYAPEIATQVFFGHASDPDSLESATIKAAWLDEAGQDKFRPGSWEAIQARLAINVGRVLITTTPYCYDETTEIYTRSGWKRFGDLLPTDDVMACDRDGASHFERPQEIVWQDYDGPMLAFKGGRVDLLVTPNHRMLYRNSGHYFTKTAEHFAKLNHRSLVIPKRIKRAGPFPETFTLPAVTLSHRWGNIREAKPVSMPMGQWCAFMGWFLSEGSVKGCKGGKITRQSYRVSLCQNDGAKRTLMEQDADAIPVKWHRDRSKIVAANKQLWAYLSQFGNSGTKFIPDAIKQASPEHQRIFIDRMVLGDGNYRHDRHGEFSYYTTSPQLAKDFAEVCMLAGISTRTTTHANNSGRIGNRVVKSSKPIYHVCERRRHGAIVKEHSTVHYSGKIGCVSVSTGFVLVRRNGEEVICGNSLGWLKRKFYDLWKAGDQTYDVIRFDSKDNPTFPLEEYYRLERSMPRWKFNRDYRGMFEKPAGQVYDCFDPDLHIIPPMPIPKPWRRFMGIDFGGTNTAAVFLALDPDSGIYYLYREYGPIGGRTAKQHVEAIKSGDPRIDLAVGGAGSEGQWRDEFRASGLIIKEPEVTAVEVGIDRTYALITAGNLRVFSTCERSTEQIQDYTYITNDDGEPQGKIRDKETMHLCFVPGTLVATRHGFNPIESIKVGDEIMTRQGFRPATAAGMSRVADVKTVLFSDGRTLTGTVDHPVWVHGKGFVPIDALRYADTIISCENQSHLPVALITDIHKPNSFQTEGTSNIEGNICIELSGNIATDRYQKDATFTTRTGIIATTTYRILSALRRLGIYPNTIKDGPRREDGRIWRRFVRWLLSGIEVLRDTLGMSLTVKKLGVAASQWPLSVNIAGRNTKQKSAAETNSVPTIAGRLLEERRALTTSFANASFAPVDSSSTNIHGSRHARPFVVKVFASGQSPVYNLTVDEDHEYFANGVLVSNCDALRYICTAISKPRQIRSDPRMIGTNSKKTAVGSLPPGVWHT